MPAWRFCCAGPPSQVPDDHAQGLELLAPPRGQLAQGLQRRSGVPGGDGVGQREGGRARRRRHQLGHVVHGDRRAVAHVEGKLLHLALQAGQVRADPGRQELPRRRQDLLAPGRRRLPQPVRQRAEASGLAQLTTSPPALATALARVVVEGHVLTIRISEEKVEGDFTYLSSGRSLIGILRPARLGRPFLGSGTSISRYRAMKASASRMMTARRGARKGAVRNSSSTAASSASASKLLTATWGLLSPIMRRTISSLAASRSSGVAALQHVHGLTSSEDIAVKYQTRL